MDIRNPDLTKKVLAALNPNKILAEDTFEKQRDMVRRQKPYGKQMEDEAQQKVLRQSTEQLNKEIKKQTVPLSEVKPENFNMEYLNSIQDKNEFLKFIDTIYDIYPRIKNREYGLDVYPIIERAAELYQNKFTKLPNYSLGPLNSKKFDKLFEIKESLKKKLSIKKNAKTRKPFKRSPNNTRKKRKPFKNIGFNKPFSSIPDTTQPFESGVNPLFKRPVA